MRSRSGKEIENQLIAAEEFRVASLFGGRLRDAEAVVEALIAHHP
jgi:hypothetical protein